MKIIFDSKADVLRLLPRDTNVAESDEGRLGVILDYDTEGNLVGLEILDASRRTDDPRSVEFAERQ